MREFLALEAELKQGRSGTRISQGIPMRTVPLDEALEAVRGVGGGSQETVARERLLRRKGTSVASLSSVSYSTEELIHPVVNSTEDKKHDYELANVWASMLQTADLKSTLEAKINALGSQLSDIKNGQQFKRRDCLEEITNQRFANLHEVQQQQIQMQSLMMSQLVNQQQHQRQQPAPIIVQQAQPMPQPRREVPEPTPPNSHRQQVIVKDVPQHAPTVVTVNERRIDDRENELDWLDEVAPLPVRPSSPILIGQEPIRVVIDSKHSKFDALTERMDEIRAKRKQFEQNLAKSKKSAFSWENEEDEMAKKVDAAIDDAMRNQTERPVREAKPSKVSKPSTTTKKGVFRKATATRLSQAKTATRSDRQLRNIYGKAAWEDSPKKVRNPYVHVNSPEKRPTARRTLTNVRVDQARHVRSQKQQTTPRETPSHYSAVQLAPPVRAGPIDRTSNPSPVLTTDSSVSETLSETVEAPPPPPVAVAPPPLAPIEKPIKISGKKTPTEPPMIIKPAYAHHQPINAITESQLDTRLGSLKGWIESELMSKLLEARQKPETKAPPPNQLRDEAALRMLIEQRLRDVLNSRAPPTVEPVSVAPPVIIKQVIQAPPPRQVKEASPSPPSPVYKPLSYMRLEQFVDETLQEISTPVPTPPGSLHSNTIEHLIENDDSHSDSKYQPMAQHDEEEDEDSMIIHGGSVSPPILTEKTDSDLSIQNHSTPLNTVKSRRSKVKRKLFNESIKSDMAAMTPVHSSTPGKEELAINEPRPRLVVHSAAVQAQEPEPVRDEAITLSQSSTYISSTDASISPGQLINSFGEFKISKHIKHKIMEQRQSKSNSLSEGELAPKSDDYSPNVIMSMDGMSEGEYRPRLPKFCLPLGDDTVNDDVGASLASSLPDSYSSMSKSSQS